MNPKDHFNRDQIVVILEDSPTYSKELFELGIPVLGLCYGAQLMQHVLGGKVERANVREYGKSILLVDQPQSKILKMFLKHLQF